MKIRTITCHHVYNYGAILQAYALQHYLETLGHEVEIIDFNPWFLRYRYNPFFMPKKAIGKVASIVRILPFMRYVLCPLQAWRGGMFKTWGRKARFNKFEADYYHLTPTKYYSSEQLQNNPPEADVYIAGSDQIWNTFCENGIEPGYYLDFGEKNHLIRRISYAASLATSSIKPGCEIFVKAQLQKFNAISVREHTGAKLLENLGINNVSVVLDPVFLLEKEEWRTLAKKGKTYGLQPDSYILVYDFLGNDDMLIAFVKNYAKLRSLQIVSINDFSLREYADININNAGPLEFLSLIDNAACVVASSFHATAFSVIFEKEFYIFTLRGHNNSSRMQDFLDMLHLGRRFNATTIDADNINWQNIESLLRDKKAASVGYLVNSLG